MPGLDFVLDIALVNMKALIAAGFLGFLIGVLPVQAQDQAAAKLYKKVCRNCHGPTAKGMASFPGLTGQTAEYLAMRLMQYRSGEKVGPNTALMAPQAAKLSDGDIAGLTAYIAVTFN